MNHKFIDSFAIYEDAKIKVELIVSILCDYFGLCFAFLCWNG